MTNNYNVLDRATGEVVISKQTPTGNLVTFANIPQYYTDLHLHVFGRSDQAAIETNLILTANQDTGAAKYVWEFLAGTGAAAVAGEDLADPGMLTGSVTGATAPANSFAFMDILIGGYRTNVHKPCIISHGRRNAVGSGGTLIIGLFNDWLDTGVITRLDLTLAAGNFVTPSYVTLYGIP